ncbi:MAG: hypothetical protein J7500_18505 [Sphingomonas sp.]|uniref:hypothetical protein n=1 Tax=Sphingomonas sp. TaxID=28214 RepID=UPI001B256F25|nr:hypothetical protein [Sphingomonas sp.]MBO9624703.1 hypothetical protein [Sphingomonas sp.]
MPQQHSEREYLEHRLRTSKQMADEALDPAISLIHQQFAAEYAKRLETDSIELAEPPQR